MPSIFINYRTSESLPTASFLDRELSSLFGAKEVFRAGRSIEGGKDFGKKIHEALRKCDVLIALIGPGWRDARTEDGRRALDDPQDWVRFEIAEALRLGLTVIPVLLDRTPRLTPADVPEPLTALTRLQSLKLDHRYPDDGIAHIVEAVTAAVPALSAKQDFPRGRAVRPKAADGGFRGNVFLDRALVDGDVVGGDKHVWGAGERHG